MKEAANNLYACKDYLKQYYLQALEEGGEEFTCDCKSCRMWEEKVCGHCALLLIDKCGSLKFAEIAKAMSITEQQVRLIYNAAIKKVTSEGLL